MAVTRFVHDKSEPAVPGWPDIHGHSESSYVGAVLSLREMNGYDDSDFYASVWDEAEGRVKEVEYASTRGWTYLNGASIDATPEVRAKAAAWYAARRLEALKAEAAEKARTPAVGKLAKVVRGRKVAKGTEGTIIWVGEGKYYGPIPRYRSAAWSTKGALRVGLKDAAGTVHWTAASNVEVTDPEEWVESLESLEARATREAKERYAA